jgi:hypothetical protein
MPLRSMILPAVALAAAAMLLSGCLVTSVAGAAVGVAGAAVGVTAKAVGATARGAGAIISGGKKDEKSGG